MGGSGYLLTFITPHSTAVCKSVSQNIRYEIGFSGLHTEKISVSQTNVWENSGKQRVIRFLYCRTTWSLLYVDTSPGKMLLIFSSGRGLFKAFGISNKIRIPFYIYPFRYLSTPAKTVICLCNTLEDNILTDTRTPRRQWLVPWRRASWLPFHLNFPSPLWTPLPLRIAVFLAWALEPKHDVTGVVHYILR